jgi:hypothetical protein
MTSQSDDVSCCSVSARARCCVDNASRAPLPRCCYAGAYSSRRWSVTARTQGQGQGQSNGQGQGYSCCHTPASVRVDCCAATAYLAPCCETMRRRY